MPHDPSRIVLSAARQAAEAAGAPLLLAVSGGLDSMVLLHAMASVARGRIAAVATFDHGTGAAARTAARMVADSAARLGLECVSGAMHDPVRAPDGREAAWRARRHEFLGDAAKRLGARVTTAHTEDDQVETVLMRVMRGTGARGLAGLYADGPVARPFVRLRRSELRSYALATGVSWVEDPSNASREFSRNRARLDLLPAMRMVAPGIDADLLRVAEAACVLRRDVEAIVNDAVRPRVESRDRLVVASRELADYDRDSLAMLWSALAGRVGLALDRRGTRRAAEFTSSHPRSGSIPLAGGWCLEAGGDVYILQRATASTSEAEARLPVSGSLDWGRFRFRASSAPSSSSLWSASIAGDAGESVRAWSAGDRLGPAAGQPRRRVTRYLSDVGVRGADRIGWPVVVAGEDVVWIPGVRRSDAATDRSGRPVRHYVCERIDR